MQWKSVEGLRYLFCEPWKFEVEICKFRDIIFFSEKINVCFERKVKIMTKIDIYSGFLGAGKTTLIKKMIQEGYQGERLVLIRRDRY